MIYDEDLSKNFKLSEFVYSRKAIENGIPNIPSATEIASLKDLVVNVLQPIRNYFSFLWFFFGFFQEIFEIPIHFFFLQFSEDVLVFFIYIWFHCFGF